MIAGRMRHQDSSGGEGLLENGGVQWMTAARGSFTRKCRSRKRA